MSRASVGNHRDTARSHRWGSLWRRYRFHLSLLVVLVPLPNLSSYLWFAAPVHDDVWQASVEAGPYTLAFASEETTLERGLGGRLEQEIEVALTPQQRAEIQAIFLTVVRAGDRPLTGQASSRLPLSTVAEGRGYAVHSHVPCPPAVHPDSVLHVDVQTWTGDHWQGDMPLRSLLLGQACPKEQQVSLAEFASF